MSENKLVATFLTFNSYLTHVSTLQNVVPLIKTLSYMLPHTNVFAKENVCVRAER